MTRRLVIIALVAALALAAALAANAPGQVEIAWFGWEVAFHPVWLILALALLWLAAHLARRAWTWLRWKSGLFGPARTLRRQRAALASASGALAALVSGQDERASTLSAEALKSDPTNQMARSIAALTGDAAAIASLETARATAPLAALARLRNAPSASSALAATRAAPTSVTAWRTLTRQQAHAGDFDAARAALSSWRALDDQADAQGDWIEASLLTASADAALDDEPAREALLRALKVQPRFAPGGRAARRTRRDRRRREDRRTRDRTRMGIAAAPGPRSRLRRTPSA